MQLTSLRFNLPISIILDWVGAVEARSYVFLSSVTRGVKRKENSLFILNNMLGKNDQNGTRRKREDCESPITDCLEAKRLNENQGSMSDLHKDMKEASAKHVQDPALAAIWEKLVRIEANTNCLISEQTIPAAKLRGAS